MIGGRPKPPAVAGTDLEGMMRNVVREVESYNPRADHDKLWRAYRFGLAAHGDQRRRSGEPYFIHSLTVAALLAEMRMDVDTIVAGLLHDVVEDTPVTLEELRERFGADVAKMVDGVTKISDIRSHNPETRRAENYRKLVFSIAEDPRTILIKMADRLHNMRTIEFLPPQRQASMSRETLDVYAPLAHRFGLARIKWELEDRAFKVLDPRSYFEIERGINQTRAERERLIQEVSRKLGEALSKEGVEAEIVGRPKHFYSIYHKMKTQGVSLDHIYDLLALRILVHTKVDCYHALGIVHHLYTPLQDRIKDYIASPKPNMYQSLHTTVQGPGGKFIEIQIRTYEMHERSELGIAAHWKYKEGTDQEELDFSRVVAWLRQIMEWQQDVVDPREFMESMKIDLFQDEIFVFSPQGDLFKLPRGATPLDFAFEVHTEVGLHCVGAKINDRIVSLGTELQNSDKVEILTSRNAHPSTSWLQLVRTSKAKYHLRRWIRSSQFVESVRLGKEMLERELRRRKLKQPTDQELIEAAQQLGMREPEKLLAAIGRGDVTVERVVHRLHPEPKAPPACLLDAGRELYATVMRRKAGGVRIQGLDSLMVRFTRCCEPIPGDEIIGLVTRGRGVSVHRVGCPNLKGVDPERLIEVTWDVHPDQVFIVKIIVRGEDRRGLLADLSDAIRRLGTNIHSGDFTSDEQGARITLTVEVRNLNNLEKILKAIRKVPSVEKVERYQIG